MIEAVSRDTIERIARYVFGADTRVERARVIGPKRWRGIVRTPASTRNLVYRVALGGHSGEYVFRFNRGPAEDRYPQEVENYELIARCSGIRVPRVYAVDRSLAIAPTAYMVLDFLPGEHWRFVAHPENRRLAKEEKHAIMRRLGAFYGRVHGFTKPTHEGHTESVLVVYALDRLEQAVRAGEIDVDLQQVEACRRAAAQESAFRNERLSLCLGDTEVLFRREGHTWDLLSVCDPEWAEFRNPYYDLSYILPTHQSLWELDQPIQRDPREVAEMPFFQGYAEMRPFDAEEFVRLSAYYQLALWGYLASEKSSKEKKEWIRTGKGALINELVRLIAARAT